MYKNATGMRHPLRFKLQKALPNEKLAPTPKVKKSEFQLRLETSFKTRSDALKAKPTKPKRVVKRAKPKKSVTHKERLTLQKASRKRKIDL